MGTQVRCRNDTSSAGHLKHGDVYEVASDDGYEYQLVGVPGKWMHSRFQVVKSTGMKVKCIDNLGARTVLTVGKVYEVHGDEGDEYQLVGVRGSWMHSRFQVVEEAASPTVDIKVGDTTPKVDEVEERCWRLLRPTVAADECCAGACKKAVCWIHKDT